MTIRSLLLTSILFIFFGYAADAYSDSFKNYGYAWYVDKTNEIMLVSGAVGKKINGHTVPIRLGSRDFFLFGKKDKIMRFLSNDFKDCFVMSQKLKDNGHWQDASGSQVHVVILQHTKIKDHKTVMIQSLAKKLNKILWKSDISGFITSLQDVLFSIDPVFDSNSIADSLINEIKSVLSEEQLEELAAKIGENSADSMDISKISKEKSKKMVHKLLNSLKDYKSKDLQVTIDKILSKNGIAFGGKYINSKNDIIVQLTSTPPLSNDIKAVFSMGSYKVTCAQIAKNINNYFEQQPIEHFAPIASFDSEGDIF